MKDIHPIKPMLNISIFDTKVPLLLGLFFVTMLLIFFVWLYKKRSKNDTSAVMEDKEPKISTKEIISKYEECLIENKKLLHSGNVYKFSLTASELIKSCLSEVYKTSIRELTTSEIRDCDVIPGSVSKKVLHFLQTADREKFSNETYHDLYHDINHDMFSSAMNVFNAVRKNLNLSKDKVELDNGIDKK